MDQGIHDFGSVTTARSRFAERTSSVLIRYSLLFRSDSRPPIASNPFLQAFLLRAPAHSRDRQPLPLCFSIFTPCFLYFKEAAIPFTGSHSFFVYSHTEYVLLMLLCFLQAQLSVAKSFCIVNCHVSQNFTVQPQRLPVSDHKHKFAVGQTVHSLLLR